MKFLLVCIFFIFHNLTLAGCSVIDKTSSVPYTKKAYTATYERIQDGRTETWIVSSNGQGRIVVVVDSKKMQTYQLIMTDYQQGKCYFLNVAHKRGLWTEANNTGGFLHDEEWLKSIENVTPLGLRDIQGRKCRGWKWTIATGETELWFAREAGCLVYGINKDNPTTGRNSGWTERLVRFSEKPLPENSFKTSEYHFDHI